MMNHKSYFAFLVFFVMGYSMCWSQSIVSDSIMEKYNVLVMSDSGNVAAYGNVRYNQPHGEWIYFNTKGGPMSKGGFKDGLKHGKWYFYDTFGDLLTTGRYKKGKMHGNWIFHYIPGKCEAKYKENLKITTTCLND